MPKLPTINGKQLVKYLESINFKIIRKKGSHVRLKAVDGKITTVPLHGKKDIPKGLLRKIIREDLEMGFEEFVEKYLKLK